MRRSGASSRRSSPRPISAAFCRASPTRRSSAATSSPTKPPTSEKIRTDLKKLSTLARAVRLYSSTEGAELVPPIAAEFGLKVTLGVWIDTNADRNDREIKEAIELARDNSNVIGIVIGNETIFRAEQIPIENLWVLPLPKGNDPAEAERIRREQREQMDRIRPRWSGSSAMNRSASGMPARNRRTSAPKR